MTAIFTYTSSPTTAGSSFAFKVKDVVNPHSTEPSSSFTGVQMEDISSGKLAGFSGTVTVTDTTAATITTRTLT